MKQACTASCSSCNRWRARLKLDEERLDMKSVALFRNRLWPYMRRHRLLLLTSLGLVLLTTVCSLLTPWLLGYAVDHVLIPRAAQLLVPFALIFFGTDF